MVFKDVMCDLCAGAEGYNEELGPNSAAAIDRLGLEAIKSLHSQLDDDANGNIDLSESDDVRIDCSFGASSVGTTRRF